MNFGGNRKIVSVIFVLGVLLLVAIIYALFSSLTAKNYNDVLALNERQTEIVRVADLGISKATDDSTRAYIATIRTITASEASDTTAFLKKKGIKVTAKQLASKKDTSTDKSLVTAQQTNNYNKVLLLKINGLLSDYQKAEKAVPNVSASVSEKALYVILNTNAQILTGAVATK